MGEHHRPFMENQVNEEASASLEGGQYTADWFVCGLCGLKICDIESYVSHMVLKEQCVLHLCPSSSIRDLLLPRFSKKRAEIEEADIKHVKDLVPIMYKETCDLNETDVKLAVQASEIETGSETRWKCQLCGLTFSRQAAIFNHFKLQHTAPSIMREESSVSERDIQDVQVKKEIPMDSKAPIKHIVAVKSKSHHKHLHNDIECPSKTWNKLVCHLCGQTFKTGKILRTHIAVVHSQGRPFHCTYGGCTQSFKTKGSLTRHERRHTGERPFTCQECGRSFRESGSLARHQQSRVSCVNKEDSQIPLYGKTLPLNSSHIEKKPCMQDIKMNTILKQEVLGNVSDDDLQKDLPLWNTEETKSVLRNENMATNVDGTHEVVKQEDTISHQLHHSSLPDNSNTLVPCKIEMPLIPTPLIEEKHLLVYANKNMGTEDLGDIKPPHLTSDIIRKSFTCPVCCQNYCRRSTLASHLKLHLDELGEKCNECGKSFATQQALSRHLSSHSSVRQFVCQLCKKAFKLLNHARSHLRTHTTTKTIPCRYCNNLYKTKSARNMHERTHNGVKTFICIECRKAFVTKASLIRHLRIHTGEAPFHCQYCGRCFKEHGTLSRHLKHKMPCAQQASMEAKTGDVGIRLVKETKNQKIAEIEINDKHPKCNQEISRDQKNNKQIVQRLSPEPSASDFSRHHNMQTAVSFSSSLLEKETGFLVLGNHTPSSHELNTDEYNIQEDEHEKPSYIFITNHNCGSLEPLETFSFIADS
ncbi:transcription factor E4F1 isoform X2 [Procambarus clarkii]|uniref:transcription factor E4F1 isoform X2 n=1 Tax=Procambarus clarkii TaxID=6728 RepID=UPI001E677B45|nr:transcription factor E4F1-like isoform X1 [Procambarus clarkii]XP_045595636.1 transcription factor E4F1-like isoform X1 [Procambarus clarkii]XP_045595637.1 transcription factor E4F1-like isoform X1 [Procambarus clarkii]XP_045595638.1 transcription factor E4F1-like isoform X1 [Procambarus clarkii]